jgi:hypothetical protein
VGTVARIKGAEQTYLNEIRQSLTLAFTQDGMKLILIDDLVQVPQEMPLTNRERFGFSVSMFRVLIEVVLPQMS